MGNIKNNYIEIDIRNIAPGERRGKIFERFLALGQGQELHVIADHDPVHLLGSMKSHKLPVDVAAYRTLTDKDGTFTGIFKKLEHENVNENFLATDIDQERNYLPDRFNPVTVYTGENYRVIITYIKAGQFIPVHSPSTDLIFSVFKGNGSMVAGDREINIHPGSIVIVHAGEKRGGFANTDMEAFHVVSPVPDEKDHLEVKEKLESKKYI